MMLVQQDGGYMYESEDGCMFVSSDGAAWMAEENGWWIAEKLVCHTKHVVDLAKLQQFVVFELQL